MLARKIYARIKKLLKKVKEIGLISTLSLIFYKLLAKSSFPFIDNEEKSSLTQLPITPLPISYKIILEGLSYKHKKRFSTYQSQKLINLDNQYFEFIWLVPFFSKGSGGHKNLFRFIKGLENLGAKCTVYIVGEYDLGLTSEEIKQQIGEYFETINADVKIYHPGSVYEKASVVVCTSWITAYAALTFDADINVYFVQDYEPSFYSLGSYWHLAESTYRFEYYHITLGSWLTHLLRQKYGVDADYYDILVDKNIYYPRQIIKNQAIKSIGDEDNFKVCFYGRSVTPRRCFELVGMALHLFAEEAKDINLISYGWNDMPPVSFPCFNLGMLSPEDLAELYSVCDVCIAPSATNLSLVAREVMACECVLMDIDVENTSYDLKHLENSYLVKPDPQSIANGLLNLYNDRQLLEKIKATSLQSALNLPTWQSQVDKFYNLIIKQSQKMDTSFIRSLPIRQYLSEKYIAGEGIEIGALHRPLYISPAAKVKYVDRYDTNALKEHYPEFASCNFVEVDIFDDGESLSSVQDNSRDFVIANHFIEHCEDPIKTIENHLRVLKKGGILYMAVPDKSLTFDIDRPVTDIEHLKEDYLHGSINSRKDHFYEWVNLVVKASENEIEEKVKYLMDTKYSIH
ncbi:glycosyltransferase, partial [Nostoc sp. UCD121]|uniref:rhamnosyltransferase WsaF family glycosyltransferase n=1 Tax=Nostoc sp. UCD121 TaxID=2681305 RepID=UPI00162AECD5